jgi:hypothetical protein
MNPRILMGVAAVFLAGAAGCARPYPPPGGDRPESPPLLIDVVPEPLSVQPAGRAPVAFRFDRRISERLPVAPVLVSPVTSEIRWQRGRSEIRVSLENGWEPGQIYRVVLLPGVRDLFGNVTADPIEVVFSTGPEILNTAVAGIVTDRLTGQPVTNGMVEAVRQADSVTYVAPTDTAGFFSLRHLPRGEYATRAWTDLNRNRRLDPAEPVSPAEVVGLHTGRDTVPLLLTVLVPDTTPARLARAEIRDSLQVLLTFDDYFPPDAELESDAVALLMMPDSTPGPRGRLMTPSQHRVMVAQLAAAAGDTAAPAAAEPPAPGRGAAGAPQPPAPPLPTRELIFVPEQPLQAGAEYRIIVAGVSNISGIPGGGGEATATAPARSAPPAPPAQGTQAPEG